MEAAALVSSIPPEVKNRFAPYLDACLGVLKNTSNMEAVLQTKMKQLVCALETFVNQIQPKFDAGDQKIEDTTENHFQANNESKVNSKDLIYAESVLQSLHFIAEPDPETPGDGALVTAMLQKFLKYDSLGATILCCEPSADNNHITSGNKLDIVMPRFLAFCNVSSADQEVDCEQTQCFFAMPSDQSSNLLKQLFGILVYAEFCTFKENAPNAFKSLDAVMSSLSEMSGDNITLSTAMAAFYKNPSLFEMDIPENEIDQIPEETERISKWLTAIAKINNMSHQYIESLKDILNMTIAFATNKSGNADPIPLMTKLMSMMTMNTTASPKTTQ